MLSFCRPVSRLFSVLLIACLPLFSCVQAQSLQAPEFSSEQASLSVTPLVDGLKITWGMDFIDDRQLLFTQRSGKLGLLNLQTKLITWLSGLPEVYAQRQGGLLDVKVAESFAYTGLVYLTYSKPIAASSVTTLARAKLQGDKLVDWQDLLITDSSSATSIHYGSRITFDGKGHVFFSVGDRGQRHQAQNLSNHQGTIIRLHLDGSVPEDNPFVNLPDALPEIWSYGHRNPQGLFFDKTTNQLWEIEHGPRGGDEINLIEKGKNYGWPVVSQGKEYSREQAVGVKHQAGMTEPVQVYIPSIAPSDLLFYRGTSVLLLKDKLITGAMKLRHLNAVSIQNNLSRGEKRYLLNLNQRIRALAQAPDGRLFVATDHGVIYQIHQK